MRATVILSALCVIALEGCTTRLSTRPSYAVSAPEEALPGMSYSLPMLQYGVDLTYQLSSCPGIDATGKATTLGFKVKAVATSHYAVGESYTIDYRALTNVFKVTDFSIETYPGGTLKALNASAEDKSADVIKGAVDLAISGASLAAGNPTALLANARADDGGAGALADAMIQRSMMNQAECTPQAVAALAAADLARNDVERWTKAIEAGTKIIDAITVRATNKLSAPSDRSTLLATHIAQLDRLEKLAVAQAALDKAEKGLSITEDRLWPESSFISRGGLGGSGVLSTWLSSILVLKPSATIDEAALRSTLNENLAKTPAGLRVAVGQQVEAAIAFQKDYSRSGLCSAAATVGECVANKVGVYAELVSDHPPVADCNGPASAYDRPCRTTVATIAARTNFAWAGVFVRQPARARLFLCDENRPCSDGDREPLHRSDWITAPQLGQLRFIPFTNGPFQNNALSLALAEDGTITKMQYAEKSAILAGALASASSAASAVQAYEKQRDADRAQALTAARAEATYQRGEVTYQRSEVTAARTEEIAAIQFEIDKNTKAKALNDQLHPATAADPVVAADYANETIRLNAVAAQLQARLAVLTAQRSLDAATVGH